MKTERRHELKTNELDHLLVEGGQFLRKHGTTIVGAVSAVVILIAGIMYFRQRSTGLLDSAYNELQSLTYATDEESLASITALKDLSNRVGDPAFVLDTLETRAAAAASRMVDQETGAVKPAFAEAAQEAYEQILKGHPDNATACGMALAGLAGVEETLFLTDHDLARRDKARGYLQRIVDDARLRTTPLSLLAVDRLNRLDKVFVVVKMVDPPATQPATTDPLSDAAAVPE